MNCNCIKAYPIPVCVRNIRIGVVDPGLTSLTVEFKDPITDRSVRVANVDPSPDGILTVEVIDIASFFSTNFNVEVRVFSIVGTAASVVPVSINGSVVECVTLGFVQGSATIAVMAIDTIQQLKIVFAPIGAGETLSIGPTFSGSFIIEWGDDFINRLYSGTSNNHLYSTAGTFLVNTTGHFEDMSEFSVPSQAIDVLTLPPAHGLININATGNKLATSNIDAIIMNVDNAGTENGTLSLQGQTPAAPPTVQSLGARNALLAKGWTITTD